VAATRDEVLRRDADDSAVAEPAAAGLSQRRSRVHRQRHAGAIERSVT